ncbi:LamG-like jellyroll fold domain-containing protein [Stackebrandtia albiflava]|uniref:LamG-like jellyroll fold domain-containing protein n=1 Tax=Stackebrandtia albiflava TaxID=406432 RepID=UPI0013157545|nr:LamG-like jellyroll fold domain-containing protein [Stackebrandtia albiflava]
MPGSRWSARAIVAALGGLSIMVASPAVARAAGNPPTDPVAVRTAPGGDCATEAPGPWINDSTPMLYGQADDADGTVKVEFALDGPSGPLSGTTPWTMSGQERSWTPTALSEGAYEWRVRGTDTADVTPWTPMCHFSVDTSAPSAPIVELISGPPRPGEPVTFRLTAADALSGMSEFQYGFNFDAPAERLPSTGTAELTVVPDGGPEILDVWAVDAAGNRSTRVTYDFFVHRPALTGHWGLHGDGVDSSGSGNDLAVPAGVGFGPDQRLVADSAAVLGGDQCLSTVGPAVDTADSFSVSAWADPADSGTERMSLVSQIGEHRAAFRIQRYEDGYWHATVATADSVEDPEWRAIRSDEPATGEWQHLALTFAASTGTLNLYVDGRWNGSLVVDGMPWQSEGPFLVGCQRTSHAGDRDHFTGSVSDVRAWDGMLSAEEVARVHGATVVRQVAYYPLEGPGSPEPVLFEDYQGDNDLAADGDFTWGPNRFESARGQGAWQPSGNACATTSEPVIDTSASFSFALWAKPMEAADRTMTLVSQGGQHVDGFQLRYSGVTGGWELAMPAEDATGAVEKVVAAHGPVAVGKWVHLAGVFDAVHGELRLYVDGALAGTVTGVEGFSAMAGLRLGAGSENGTAVGHFAGSLDELRVWYSTLGAERIAELAAT